MRSSKMPFAEKVDQIDYGDEDIVGDWVLISRVISLLKVRATSIRIKMLLYELLQVLVLCHTKVR